MQHITAHISESLANPLFFESYLDYTQVTDPSLLVCPIVRYRKDQKHVHWADDDDDGQPLVELFTYIGNWDRTPIQVSHLSKQKMEEATASSRFLLYICLSFFVALLVLMG